MNLKRLGFILLILFTFSGGSMAQILPQMTGKKVSEEDPLFNHLREWQIDVEKKYEKTKVTEADFGPWQEIETNVLMKLFPEYRFFTISWNEKPNKDFKGDALVHRAFGLYVILALNKESQDSMEFSGHGNYDDYGKLLAKHKIKIENETDAKLVWEGFCDLHQKSWKTQDIEKINDTIWHLGIITIRDFTYFYRVELDQDQQILSATLVANKNP